MKAAASTVLISETEIQRRVAEMGARISDDYRGRAITVVGILKGSFLFIADLTRQIDTAIPVEIEFMTVSSYAGGTTSSGKVHIGQDIECSISGKDVLIVEDIVDTGLTIAVIRDLLASRGAASIRIATLLEKETGRGHPLVLDYVGFKIPDQFVVGYGLDYAQRYRNLKEIRVFQGPMSLG
jgi:hypoxanthine phosphoribosyltransferase